MNLSVVIPAHNEEECVRATIERLYSTLMDADIPFEILVVNDHSTDTTERVLQDLMRNLPGVRYVNNQKPGGFGFAIQTGLERFRGDAVCIVMADASDDPRDVVTYYHMLEEGYECVFGSRFMRGSRVVDYPIHKLLINRMANAFINTIFQLGFNDTTNAFKAYRREVIEGVKPFLSPHFNITVELPLKAIARGYTYATVPINWYNRVTGVSKLRIKEMGSRYLFIVLYVWLERLLSRGDYRRKVGDETATNLPGHSPSVALEETLRRQAVLPAFAQRMDGGVAIAAPTSVSTHAPADETTTIATPVVRRVASRSNPLGPVFAPMLAGILSIVPVMLVSFILLMIWTRTPHFPYWDEWETVTLMQHFTHGVLTWNDFWAFHNEHRIVIPQMISLVLILVTHWNRQIEMTFDLLLGVAECVLLLVSAHRGLGSRVLTILAIAPISLALFSFSMYEDWLWPFQMAFICTVFGVALCLWGLTDQRRRWSFFVLSLVGATIAALSSLGGLAVFVAFLPAVVSQGYKKTILWVALAVGVIVPYMQGFPHSVPIKISLLTIKFCITFLGAPVGQPSVKVAFGAGAASLALAVVNVLFYWAREKRIATLLPWVGLGGYALGLALIISFGRVTAYQPLDIAFTSRYQMFAVLWWVAVIYVLLLNCRGAWQQLMREQPEARNVSQAASWIIGVNTLALIVATVGLALGSWQSIPSMRSYQYAQLESEACVVNAYYAPTPCLWQFYPSATILQERVDYLRAQRYALFGENYQVLQQPAPSPSAHALVRYYDPANNDYWVTTNYDLSFYGPYGSQQILGYLYDQQQPGTHALYTCVTSAGLHFTSLSAKCSSGSLLRTEGWALNTPMAQSKDVTLYACASASASASVSGSANFVASHINCDGHSRLGVLGYALPQLP